jgi:hypothetical protein
MNFDFDEIGQRGFSAAPGTPWGTDDVVYEGTLAMECVGEFVSNIDTGEIVGVISAIQVTPYSDKEEDPTSEGGWT